MNTIRVRYEIASILRQLVQVLVILLCVALTTRAQDVGDIPPTLGEAVDLILEMTDTELVDAGEGWVMRRTPGALWSHLAVAGDSDESDYAETIVVIKDDEPLAMLLHSSGEHFSLFRGDGWPLKDWLVVAWSEGEDAVCDRVALGSREGVFCLVMDTDGYQRPNVCAVPHDSLTWVMLTDPDSSGRFGAALVYDLSERQCVAAGTPATEESGIEELYVRLPARQWAEYAFDSGELIAIGMHDSIPGTLRTTWIDADRNGLVDAVLSLDEGGEGTNYRFAPNESPIMDVVSHSSLGQVPEAIVSAARQWEDAYPVVQRFKALGYQFPEVMRIDQFR